MSDNGTLEFIMRVLRIFNSFSGPSPDGELWWRTDGEYGPVTFLINCNDVFYWGTADCEPLTPENVEQLERAVVDCRTAGDERSFSSYASALFCARVRKMRPQGAWRKELPPELTMLFDAAGPPRHASVTNPIASA